MQASLNTSNLTSKKTTKKVFEFFEKIASIPHGSKNTKKISDYLVSFAKERNYDIRNK